MTVLRLGIAVRRGIYPTLIGENFLYWAKKNATFCCVKPRSNTDEGLSTATTKKRGSFHRMVEDGKAEKLDFIITKKITRFSRNTLDEDSELRLTMVMKTLKRT